MRDRALLIDGGSLVYTGPTIDIKAIEAKKREHKTRLDKIKSDYFNAGRCAAGARDKLAVDSFKIVGLL
jgi:hypothetical protein